MKKETSTNFMQVIPNSHNWASIESLILFLQYQIRTQNTPDIIDYLITGLQNTLANGYQLSQSPPSLQWVKASERLPKELGKVHWRESDGKLPITAGFAYKYAISENESDLVEWLDESQDTAKQPREKGYECKVCGQGFETNDELYQHYDSKHNKGED